MTPDELLPLVYDELSKLAAAKRDQIPPAVYFRFPCAFDPPIALNGLEEHFHE